MHQGRRVPILMYHQITPRPHPAFRTYAVGVGEFARQMAWLARARYTAITLDALLAHRAGRGPLPARPVVITFDDGFRDCADYAAPIMHARGFTATFYLVASLVGQSSRWLMRERGVEFPLFDWSAARRLEAQGFACEAHSLTHPRLAGLPEAACRQELRDSRALLEDQLGREVAHLAYPFGSHDARVRAIAAEEGYRSACTVSIGLSAADDDALALRRVPVIGGEGLLDFAARVYAAHSLGEWLRHRVALVARRHAGGTAPR